MSIRFCAISEYYIGIIASGSLLTSPKQGYDFLFFFFWQEIILCYCSFILVHQVL